MASIDGSREAMDVNYQLQHTNFGNIMLTGSPEQMDLTNHLSIRSQIFSNPLPVNVLPFDTTGHNIHNCLYCGDEYFFESSFNNHFNRKSMQFTFMCHFCNVKMIFFNRCMLLSHIKSHASNSVMLAINVNDISIEVLPSCYFAPLPNDNDRSSICYECKQYISPSTGVAHKDRASHYMRNLCEEHSCPMCLFELPTSCALRAHLRFHLNCSPFFCPECGIEIPSKNVPYPYGHDCDGFTLMKAAIRLTCPVPGCLILHPNDLKDHLMESHIKKVHKCPLCLAASFNEATMNKHLEGHHNKDAKPLIYYQCALCPEKLHNNIDNHLCNHIAVSVYPCWSCGINIRDGLTFLEHHQLGHGWTGTVPVKNIPEMYQINELEKTQGKVKRIYRVVKRCEQCNRNYTYKCNYSEISGLPNACPFHLECTSQANSVVTVDEDTQLSCHLCNENVPYDWEKIKMHYAEHHKMHKCLDAKVVLKNIDITNYMKIKTNTSPTKVGARKTKDAKVIKQTNYQSPRQNSTNPQKIIPITIAQTTTEITTKSIEKKYICTICQTTHESKGHLETHFKYHKDIRMAYQCMECGQNYVVKPTFSTHLKVVHGILNVNEYILSKKQCYNEIALQKFQDSIKASEPLKKNQCKVCREQLSSPLELAMHFRGHGLAYLSQIKSQVSNCPILPP